MRVMKVPVNLELDVTFGDSLHMWAIYPPTPIAILPAFEFPALQCWAPGAFFGRHKWTNKKPVYHSSQFIALQDHDLGPLLSDLTVMQPNFWLWFIMLFSSRKIIFGASKVKMNGEPTGCAFFPWLPMLSCGQPVSIPFTYPITNILNTVYVGITLADIIFGWISIGIEMVLDFILDRLKLPFLEIPDSPVLTEFIEDLATDQIKSFLSAAAGFDLSALRGDPRFKGEIGTFPSNFSYDIDFKDFSHSSAGYNIFGFRFEASDSGLEIHRPSAIPKPEDETKLWGISLD